MWLNHNCSSFISMYADADSEPVSPLQTLLLHKKKSTKADQTSVSNFNHELLFTRTMAFEMKNGKIPVKIDHN